MIRKVFASAALALALPASAQPFGLDARADAPAYLSMPSTEVAVPQLLSQTGAFSAISPTTLTPNAALIPYGLIQAFWSDGAIKSRWVSVPYNSSSGTNPQVAFGNGGDWAFPDGSVFVKHFELVVNEQTGAKRRLETRVVVRKQGGHIYGRSYRWRPDMTEADSIEENSSNTSEAITITQADGTTRQQTWTYPKPSQCMQCHTVVTGGVLGVKTRQLNGNYTYESTGRTDNQLRTWGHLGLLSAPFDPAQIASYLRLRALDDGTATLLDRARSYLDQNCSNCHRPGATAIWDGRYDTPIASQQIFGDGTNGSNKLIRFSPGTSRIIVRDSLTSAQGGMPPLSKSVVHAAWISLATALVNDPFDVRSATGYGSPRIAFTQPVDVASATDPANYSVPGFTVQGAFLSQDRRIVSLVLNASLTNSTTYEVIVNGVKSAAGTSAMWPDTRRSFVAGQLDPNGDEDLDGIPNGVEITQGTTQFWEKDNDVFANARLFAMQQYRDFLGREGDTGGVDFWTQQLANGSQSRSQMAETFFNSAEFQGTGAPVARLYYAYFLRIPDYAGLNYWIGQFRAGNSLASISNAFASSAEFANRYGALTNSQFVTLVYNNVLGRAPDSAGLAYWTGQLDGGMTRGTMMLNFSESPEYRGLIANEVYVTMMYVGMLRREPDAGGFSFWVNYMDAGNSGLALTGAFVGAPEYRSRFLP